MSRFFPKDERPPEIQDADKPPGELSLLSLPGVGRSKAQALINAGFRSLQQVAETPLDELERVPGLGPKTARELHSGACEALAAINQATIVPHPRASGTSETRKPSAKLSLADFLSGDHGASRLRIDPAPWGRKTSDTSATADAAPVISEAATETEASLVGEEAIEQQSDSLDHVAGFEPEEVAAAERAGDRDEGHGPEPEADFETEGAPAGESSTENADDVYALRVADKDALDVHLSVHIDSALLVEFDRDLATEFEVLPLQRVGDSVLVASENPLSEAQLRKMSARAGRPVRAIPSQVASFDATIRTLYDDNRIRSRSKGLGEILIDLGLLTSQQLGQALAHQMRENNPQFQPVLSVDQALLHLVPEALARKFNILPLYRTRTALLLATSEHLSDDTLDKIQAATGLTPSFVIVGPSELQAAMTGCYNVRQRFELRQMWLGEILVSRGMVTRKALDTCLAAQSTSRKKLGQLLVDGGFINEDALYPILAEKLGMEYKRFEHTDVDHQLTYLLSERFAERNLVLPLRLDYDRKVLEVAICDPTNLQVRDMLESVAEAQDAELKLVLSGPARLKENIGYSYGFNRQMDADLDDLEIETDVDWDDGGDRSEITITEDLPKMRRIVNKLLYEAVTESASDIHIENLETRTQVRFRIDGILHERTTPIHKGNIQKIISVLKIDSGLNIAERRRAQDGVFKMRIGKNRNIDFRINVHATQFGEDAVIRVLDRARNLLELDDLGFAPSVQTRFESLITNPQGLILITGPTGSGKTTTLYTSLAYLNTGDKKIVTAEDPVEYHLDGITQYQVNTFIGNTFAEYMRRFLRKDPDIILVGEIRDDETAMSCIRAAMTGHLVFSTLHTNDAVSVIQRMRDLGLESSSLADALMGVIQQRLARRNCPDCRKPYTPDASLLREFFPDGHIPDEARFVRGSGCSTCHGKGLRGRIGLYEFWEVKRATRQIIAAGGDETAIRQSAMDLGLETIVRDSLDKVYSGMTTLEELRRVVPVEQIRSFSGYYSSS